MNTKNETKRIVLTGGGSAGHVTPNLAIIEALQAEHWDMTYVGSAQGIERDIIEKIGIPYRAVSSGKLRRYFSWQNFIDPFKMMFGIIQAFFLCLRLKPHVVFSKGGFAGFPVVVAAWMCRIPVIAHESDFSPGLANRLSFLFSKKICITFPETIKFFKQKENIVVTGTPIRKLLLTGDAARGKQLCGFNDEKPVLLILGGGLGAQRINEQIRSLLPHLLKTFNIIHICGKEKTDERYDNEPGYRQFAYVHDELSDLFAAADIVISRAGANSIYELIALQKPHLLIPLSRRASRGDQIHNAEYFEKKGLSRVLYEEDLNEDTLLSVIQEIDKELPHIKAQLANYKLPDSVEIITDLLQSYSD